MRGHLYKLWQIFLILAVIKVLIVQAEWNPPYFLNAGTDGVEFRGTDPLFAQVREEIPWPFTLAIVNYNGEATPKLGVFDIGSNSFLNASIERKDDKWLLTINSRQDYENPQQRLYGFNVLVEEDTTREESVLIRIENIFDNNPVITNYTTPCSAEELQSNLVTNCEFFVYDADGLDKNKITMVVNGQPNFDFVNETQIGPYDVKFNLRIIKELHYEERAVYNLNVTAYDIEKNSGRALAMLEVIDLPNMDPVWIRPLASASFPEKQEQTFVVQAIDGDTGINKPICYRLELPDVSYAKFLAIGSETGVLNVGKIDRDALQQEVFTFDISAYKCDNISWAITNATILIVQDINDHYPQLEISPTEISFLENKYLNVPFTTFVICDIDLGVNGTYNVSLLNSGAVAYSQAFELIPSSGYQCTKFRITVAIASLLDYENEVWRDFTISIKAQEIETLEHENTTELHISLINWNDELPIFEENLYSTSVNETIGKNEFLKVVRAFDRDIDDSVIHEIVGQMPGIDIDEENGTVFTTFDETFDYERQTTVMIQIKATDTLVNEYSNVLHSVFTQLTINVLDINDETPQMRMPRSTINITENSPGLTLLTDMIEARDPDTTANLTFEIVWETSYATKAGQAADSSDYEDCLIIEPYAETINLVYGHLKVNPEFASKKDIDYEKYDTIFLTIRVTDENQVVNEPSYEDMLTVRVLDVNDNAPMFIEDTLNEPRKVSEEAEKETLVGTILAIDIDGPGNNEIYYSINPIGDLTKDGLIWINSGTGVLRVSDGTIDCDIPKIDFLEYEVMLFDQVHNTSGSIKISITDINNKQPQIGKFNQSVEIYEDAKTGTPVGTVNASDADRDPPHNTLRYAINYVAADELQNLFRINTTTGEIIVSLRNGAELDRDNGVEYHLISIDVEDNYLGNGPVFQKPTFLNVTLLDVNDNAPQMPPKDQYTPVFDENAIEGTVNDERLIAPDKDQPNTPNSWVSYKILSIQPGSGHPETVEDYEELFDVIGDDKLYGQLITKKSLKGYYGTWSVEILAYDHGEPQQINSSTYDVVVEPYNFNAPKIVFPEENKAIRLCYDFQAVNMPLYEADCSKVLKSFEAYDPDGGIYGDVTFQLSSDYGDDKNFTMVKDSASRNKSMLQLKEKVVAGIYRVNLKAVDGGGKSSDEIKNLKIVFVDTHGDPVFNNTNFTTNFTESDLGLNERRTIPEAEDPKNEGIEDENDKYKIYYFIDRDYHPVEAEYFYLDKETRVLKLTKSVDRIEFESFQIKVKATNDENGATFNPNSVNSTLLVTILVNDVNNHPPIFDEANYGAGITAQDARGKTILTVHATDPDLDDPTTYEINNSTIITHGKNIEQYKFTMFELNAETGVLTLSSPVRSNMEGYFLFNITAYDTLEPIPHSDEVPVKIYIIAEVNRVTFVFMNDQSVIEENRGFLREKFQEIYGYENCYIDDIEQVSNPKNRQAEVTPGSGGPITEVRANFVDNNEAVEAIEIQRKSNDIMFISQLKNTLLERSLILSDVPRSISEETEHQLDALLLTTLIVLSVVLATLCIILTTAFVMKTRTLNRQLKAFVRPEFGSTPSNLNRIGAPTTNIFSVEGSNPVIRNNEDKNSMGIFDDSASIYSEVDCDFLGINDDPTFQQDKKTARTSEIRNNNFINLLQSSLDDMNESDEEKHADSISQQSSVIKY